MSAGTPQVLIVEDDRSTAELIQRALGALGAPLRFARSGTEALSILLDPDGKASPVALNLHLMILDLDIPPPSGTDVLVAVRSDPGLRNLPMVVFTGNLNPKVLASALAAGATSWVTKPIRPQAFEDAVRQVADYWLRLDARATTHDATPVGWEG